LMQFAGSWIRALTGITDFVRNTFLTGMFITDVPEEDRPVSLVNSARFAETCILKMLPFVDALLGAPYDSHTSSSCEIVLVVTDRAPAPADKLLPLIGVREAVSKASQDIRLSFCYTSSEEAKRSFDLSQLGLSRLIPTYLLSHNTIHSTSRALLLKSAEQAPSCGHYCSLARAACGPRNLVPHPGAAPARTARHRTAGRSPSPFSNMCGHVGGGGGARASTHRPLARSSRARRRRRRTCAPGPRGSRPAPPRNLSRLRRCTCAAAGRNERVRDRKQDLCRRR
jgi:hypothetical protein